MFLAENMGNEEKACFKEIWNVMNYNLCEFLSSLTRHELSIFQMLTDELQ